MGRFLGADRGFAAGGRRHGCRWLDELGGSQVASSYSVGEGAALESADRYGGEGAGVGEGVRALSRGSGELDLSFSLVPTVQESPELRVPAISRDGDHMFDCPNFILNGGIYLDLD